MSSPDYAQSLEDHRKVLILLKPLEPLVPVAQLEAIFDAITTYHSLTPIPGHQDEEIPRSVQARFVRQHSVENNAWGDFQAHRQALGLICVAGFKSQAELESACRRYAQCKEQFALTVVDGLLILVDLQPAREENSEDGVDWSVVQELLPFCCKDALRCRPTDSSLGPLHSRVRDFMIVLFWLLESQRLNWIQKQSSASPKADSSPSLSLPISLGKKGSTNAGSDLLMAPFEKREMVGLNRDSRQYLRRQAGRQRKHIGDLCLLCGLPAAALDYYHAAHELLRVANDWLWVGACMEGQCAASAVIHYGTGDPVQAALKSTNQSAARATQSANQKAAGSRLGVDESSLSEATRQLLDEHYMLTPDQDDTWLPGTQNGAGLIGKATPSLPKYCLSQQAMVSKYQEVMEQYKKYSMASVVCFEAGLKCCRLLIRQQDMQDFKKRLEAAKFLQKVLSIKFPAEDISVRFAVAARLYEMMLFRRKAAFYRRMSGLSRATADVESSTDLLAFLHKAAPAYDLHLDQETRTLVGDDRGWITLKVEHLHELAAAATRCGQWALAVNYCSYALDIGREWLTRDKIASFLDLLSKSRSELSDEAVVGVVHKCFFVPQIDSLKLLPLASHLQPAMTEAKRLTSSKPKSPSPFIYSPMLTPKKQHFRSRSAGGCLDGQFAGLFGGGDSMQEWAVMWVYGEMCRLELTLTNPLVQEVEMSDLRLVMQRLSASDSPPQLWTPCAGGRVSLGAGCFKTITLQLEPPTSGNFILSGLRYSLFGLESEQSLAAGLVEGRTRVRVEVVPRLPTLDIATDLLPADDFVQSEEGRERLVADGTLPLVRGKVAQFSLSLSNTDASSCDVSSLRLDFTNDIRICHLKSDYRKRCRLDDFLAWDEDAFSVPLHRGVTATIPIRLDPALLPESAVSAETLLTVEYSSKDAAAAGWCRRHVVAVVSDVSWATPVSAPSDPFAEVSSPVLPTSPDLAPVIRVSGVA